MTHRKWQPLNLRTSPLTEPQLLRQRPHQTMVVMVAIMVEVTAVIMMMGNTTKGIMVDIMMMGNIMVDMMMDNIMVDIMMLDNIMVDMMTDNITADFMMMDSIMKDFMVAIMMTDNIAKVLTVAITLVAMRDITLEPPLL
jgi:hypothetical protein